ncbi:unnamed protein product [Mytilus coruscus]|uniref:Cysteine and tyrosine-rich protein 1 n=1 Tax=Mytilus coruscus TaxID=42192 RepID=A0A6J8AHX3_MYTCO|nr:unnamed protein product [Mytilus coruscus]
MHKQDPIMTISFWIILLMSECGIVLSDVCSKYSYTYLNIYSKYCSGYCIGYYGNQYCYYYDYGTYVGSLTIGAFVGVIIGVIICIVIFISVAVAICKGCLKSDGHRGRMVYPTDSVAVIQTGQQYGTDPFSYGRPQMHTNIVYYPAYSLNAQPPPQPQLSVSEPLPPPIYAEENQETRGSP